MTRKVKQVLAGSSYPVLLARVCEPLWLNASGSLRSWVRYLQLPLIEQQANNVHPLQETISLQFLSKRLFSLLFYLPEGLSLGFITRRSAHV